MSVAIVPVGITQYRKGVPLKPVDSKCAKETIAIASRYKRVCCSDEFFLLANEKIPPAKYYGNFSQLDDGVGSIRYLLEDFKKLKKPKNIKNPYTVLFATSYAAKSALDIISKSLNKIKNLSTEVIAVKSEYWGENITVAGLITSDDLIRAVKNKKCDVVVISSVMLRQYTETFLDGKTLDYVKKKTKKDFLVIKNTYSMRELVDYLTKI